MPLNSSAVGTELGVSERNITTRGLLAYAAGVGVTIPACFDDLRPDGITACPPYCVSLEWPVVSGSRVGGSLGLKTDEAVRGVHASQDSIFHRPIRPGMRLKTTAQLAGVRNTKAGALCMMKLETVDSDSRDRVVTSWSASIFRGVPAVGPDITGDMAPSGPRRAPAGDDATEVKITIPAEAPHVYTECADIWNPIHTERAVARSAGLPDIILHGTATWAFAAREIIAGFAGGDPVKLKRLYGRFAAMVFPSTSITIRMWPSGNDVVAFNVLNHEGKQAITDGFAVIGD